MKTDKQKLVLAGRATDHIWYMLDGEDPYVVGIRLDCGDSGTVYLTIQQAKALGRLLLEQI